MMEGRIPSNWIGGGVMIRGIDGGMYRRMFVSTDVYIDGCSIRMACERGRTLVVGEDCVLEIR